MSKEEIDLVTLALVILSCSTLCGLARLRPGTTKMWKLAITSGILMMAVGGVAMYVPRSDVRPYAGMIRQGGQALMSTLVLIDWYIDSRSQNHAKEHKLRQGVLLIVSFGLLLCFTLPPVLTLWRDTQGERVTDAKVTKAIFGEFDNLKASNSLLLSQHKTDSSALIKAKDELLMSQKRHTAAILSNQEILVSSRKIMKRQLILTQKIDSILTPVSKRIRRIIKK